MGCFSSSKVSTVKQESRNQSRANSRKLSQKEGSFLNSNEAIPHSYEELSKEASSGFRMPESNLRISNMETSRENFRSLKGPPKRSIVPKVHGPKKVQTRYMRIESSKPIEEYSEAPVEYLVDTLESCFDVYSTYDQSSLRYSNPVVTAGSRAIYLPTGFVFISGSRVQPKGTWGVDLASGQFSPLALMIEPREYHSLTYQDGIVYATGGRVDQDVSSCEMFVNTGWTRLPDMNEGRSLHASISMNKRVYVCGGLNTKSIEMMVEAQWILLDVALKFPINRLGIAPLSKNTVLIAGGEASGNQYSLDAWELNFDDMKLSDVTYLPEIVLCTSLGTYFNRSGAIYSDGAVYLYNRDSKQWTISY